MNWETLLRDVPNSQGLYLIADDRDYFSVLDQLRPKEYLVAEWDRRKQSQLHCYRRIAPFFKEHYPDIELACELEKDLVVRKLVNSASFTVTHNEISKLKQFEGFSGPQLTSLIGAALSNNQINWILGDTDVYEFFSDLVENYPQNIESELYEKIHQELYNATLEDDDISL